MLLPGAHPCSPEQGLAFQGLKLLHLRVSRLTTTDLGMAGGWLRHRAGSNFLLLARQDPWAQDPRAGSQEQSPPTQEKDPSSRRTAGQDPGRRTAGQDPGRRTPGAGGPEGRTPGAEPSHPGGQYFTDLIWCWEY